MSLELLTKRGKKIARKVVVQLKVILLNIQVVYKTATGTLGRVCGDLGREGTYAGKSNHGTREVKVLSLSS